ncbi:MAG: hypothetical protein OJF55_002168 [Rhodanobacteraceae bacterium]|nr:MAG: hypothetical protein OJF55_002168 [Rhodanobacteraceae bacterium]
MNTRLQASIAMAVIGLSSVAVTHQAEACGLNLVRTANGTWTIAPPAKMSASAAKMMFRAIAPAAHTKAIPNPLQFLEPIAGLYEVTMTAEGNGPTGLPDGAPVDHAYVTWHADGSEIMNSGRPAGDANFCMGTWAQTGPRTYQLNHFMLSWAQYASAAPDPNSPPLPQGGLYYVNNEFVGPASIQETITLAKDGQSYTGTFVLTQYDTKYNIILPGGIPIKGVVTGTRKTIDSPVTY